MSSALAEYLEKLEEGMSEGTVSIVMSETGTVKSFQELVGRSRRVIAKGGGPHRGFRGYEVVVGGLEVGPGAVDYRVFRLLCGDSDPDRIRRIWK